MMSVTTATQGNKWEGGGLTFGGLPDRGGLTEIPREKTNWENWRETV